MVERLQSDGLSQTEAAHNGRPHGHSLLPGLIVSPSVTPNILVPERTQKLPSRPDGSAAFVALGGPESDVSRGSRSRRAGLPNSLASVQPIGKALLERHPGGPPTGLDRLVDRAVRLGRCGRSLRGGTAARDGRAARPRSRTARRAEGLRAGARSRAVQGPHRAPVAALPARLAGMAESGAGRGRHLAAAAAGASTARPGHSSHSDGRDRQGPRPVLGGGARL